MIQIEKTLLRPWNQKLLNLARNSMKCYKKDQQRWKNWNRMANKEHFL